MKSKFAITGLTMGSEAHKWLEYSTLDVVPISDPDHYHLYDSGVVTIKKFSESSFEGIDIYTQAEFGDMLKAKEKNFLIIKDGKARVPKEMHDRIKMDFKSIPKNFDFSNSEKSYPVHPNDAFKSKEETAKEISESERKAYDILKKGVEEGAIFNPVGRSAEDNTVKEDLRAIPYQRCPICNGHGRITNFGTSSSLYDVCSVCNGAKIIPMCIMGREVDKTSDNDVSSDNLTNIMDMLHIFRNWGIQWDIMFSKNPKNVDDLAAEISKKYNVTRK